MVAIGEASVGLGRGMTDAGLAIQRARDRTEQLQARAQALDELTAAGALEPGCDLARLDRELGALSAERELETELQRLKLELGSGGQGARG